MTFETKTYSADITVEELTKRYRDAERFGAFCRDCGNYGRLWCCPPFNFDVDAELAQWRAATVFLTKIIPSHTEGVGQRASALMRQARREVDAMLLDLEKRTAGRSFSFAGGCPHCGSAPCGRLSGEPCRHPELVRPSLEAFGFDVESLAREIFGIPVLWPAEGNLPAYLVLVTALLHN